MGEFLRSLIRILVILVPIHLSHLNQNAHETNYLTLYLINVNFSFLHVASQGSDVTVCKCAQ